MAVPPPRAASARRQFGDPPARVAWRRAAWRSAALVAIAVIGFLDHRGALDAEYVFDDFEAVVHHDEIRTLGFDARPQSPLAGRPLVTWTFSAGIALWGLDSRAHHAVNLALHLLNGVLLYLLITRVLELASLPAPRARWVAWWASALWTAHPLTSEPVCYLTQRTEAMFASCALLSLLLFTAALLRGRRRVRDGSALAGSEPLDIGRLHAASALCTLLAVMCKETGAVVPLLALVVDRALAGGSWRQVLRERGLFHAVHCAAGVGALALLLASGPRSHSIGPGHGIGVLDYALAQGPELLRYLRLALWPVGLSIDLGEARAIPPSAAVPGVLAALAIAGTTAWGLWRRPRWGIWGAWFILLLAPTSSFVPIASEVAADRRMYLPLVACTVLVALLADRLGRRLGPSDPLRGSRGAWILVALLVPWGALTQSRAAFYRDPVALWRDAVRQRPDNPRGHHNLAVLLAEGGAPRPGGAPRSADLTTAARHFARAVALRPEYDEARRGLALALARAGELDRAASVLAVAVARRQRDGELWWWSARVAERRGDCAGAVLGYGRAVAGPAGIEARAIRAATCNLAWVLVTAPDPRWRDLDRARRLLESEILQPWRSEARWLDVVAALRAAEGDVEGALRLADRLVAAARERGDPQLLAELAARREVYRRGLPFADDGSRAPRAQGALRPPI